MLLLKVECSVWLACFRISCVLASVAQNGYMVMASTHNGHNGQQTLRKYMVRVQTIGPGSELTSCMDVHPEHRYPGSEHPHGRE